MKYLQFLFVTIVMALFGTACHEYEEYEMTEGLPNVEYVRTTAPADNGEAITTAKAGSVVCLVGNNMKSVYQVLFNDQVAELNSSFITDNNLIIEIPTDKPEEVTNKIYLKNKNQEVVSIDFTVTFDDK